MSSTNITNIQDYILQFSKLRQKELQKLHEEIISQLPKHYQETITYKMPTYRTTGNIIQFAQLKNYIHIFPGKEAMEKLKKKFPTINRTQSAFQIPNNQLPPQNLIKEIISFNLNFNKNKKGMNIFKNEDKWLREQNIMEEVILSANLQETFKWNRKVYTHNNQNVVSWGGFKNFFSIWFYQGALLEDKNNVLISANEEKTKALRQWRFTHGSAMDKNLLLSYILEAKRIAEEGKKVINNKTDTPLVMDSLLKQKMEEDISFKNAFEQLTPGRQKEYIHYMNEAKQEKTKINRLNKIIPLITDGKGLHDQYKR